MIGGGGGLWVLHVNSRNNVTMRTKCAAGQLEKLSVETASRQSHVLFTEPIIF